MTKKKEKVVYMKVTRDKYELPICVFDTVKELAEYEGSTSNSVRSRISRGIGLVRKVVID